MTTLAWLVALLRPRDLAIHPNFGRPENPSVVTQFATGMTGDFRLLGHSADDDTASDLDETVRALRLGFLAHSIDAGIHDLIRHSEIARDSDTAKSTVLLCVAVALAAELEAYGLILQSLTSQLAYLETQIGDEYRLLECLLRLQRHLRLQDAGLETVGDPERVCQLLDEIEIDHLAAFPLSPATSWSSRDSLRFIADAMRNAAEASLDSNEGVPGAVGELQPRWAARVRSLPDPHLEHIWASRTDVYSEVVRKIALSDLRDPSVTFLARNADLFFTTFQLEVIGHPIVRIARTQTGLQRFTLHSALGGRDSDLSEVVPLLRRGGARREVDLAVQYLSREGPLAVLAADARQIVRRAQSPAKLRGVELAVIGAAGDLLTDEERSEILQSVIHKGQFVFAADLPGHSQLQAALKAETCRAAMRLATSPSAADLVADALLVELVRAEPNEFLDQEIARGLASFDWSLVGLETRKRLAMWAHNGTTWKSARHHLLTTLEPPERLTGVPATVDDVAEGINAGIRGAEPTTVFADASERILRQDLTQIRSDAREGRYNVGGVAAAEVAVALAQHFKRDGIWLDIADFVSDPRVAREERTPALRRIAFTTTPLPEGVREIFAERTERILDPGSDAFWPSQGTARPYPDGLLALAAHGVIADEQLLGYLASLTMSPDTNAREVAGDIVTVASRRGAAPTWIVMVALQLSHDSDASVRARAGRALATISTRPDLFGHAVALQRLQEILQQDGLLTPLWTLNALKQGTDLPPEVLPQISEMGTSHPSRSVRIAARSLLRSDTENGEGSPEM